jgi:amino acid transporter
MILKLVLLFNNIATWIKICAPIGTMVVLFTFSYHPANVHLPAHASGDTMHMFTAISTAGVFFSLFGFRQPIDLAGETKNPSRTLPIAVIGTIAIGAAIFILLQYAFVAAVPPEMLARDGWANMHFVGISGPFAGLAVTIGASFWAVALYADAIISPAMCGYIWITTTPRVLYAMGEERLWPRAFMRINRHGVPWVSVVVSYLVGILFFFPFPSWQKLVDYSSLATVVSFGIGPVVLLKLRRALPDAQNRSFKLWRPWLMASLAFIASNFVMFWAGYGVMTFLFAVLLGVFAVYVLYFFLVKRGDRQEFRDWKHAWWLIPYFAGMWALSDVGPKAMGGMGVLNIYWDMAAVAVLSLIVLRLALAASLPDQRILLYYQRVLDESVNEPVWEVERSKAESLAASRGASTP